MAGPPDLAAYRLPRSTALDGQDVLLGDFPLSFGPAWDVVEVAPGTWFADKDTGPHEAMTVVLSRASGWALVIQQRRDPAVTGRGPAASHAFTATAIAGMDQTGPPPAPTRDLVGRWHRYRYSPADLYEHIYVSGERLVSHNVDTANTSGRADCHPVSYYTFGPRLYVVAWREFDSQASMVMVENLERLRATGKVLHPESADRSVSRPVGGLIRPVEVVFPAESVTLDEESR